MWIRFILSSLVIFFASKRLPKYVRIISAHTGIGEGYLGVIALGAITSFPELVTSLSSIFLLRDPDLALSNVLGSNIFNMTIIAILFIWSGKIFFNRGEKGKFQAAFLGILMTALVGFAIFQRSKFSILGISYLSWLLLLLYLFGMRWLYKIDRDKLTANSHALIEKNLHINSIYIQCLVAALLIMVAGYQASFACKEIAIAMHWESSFVGSLFLAVATSLPELTVCLSAFKIGSPAMAIGNVFGSNIFNLAIIFPIDLLYPGSIFVKISPYQLLIVFEGILLTILAILGISYRTNKRVGPLSPDGFIMISVYFLGFWWMFHHMTR